MSNQETNGKTTKKRKRILMVLVFLLVIAMLGLACTNLPGKYYQETFAVEPGTVLKIYNGTGNIKVSSWDRDYVEVGAQSNFFNSLLKGPGIDIATGKELVIRTRAGMDLGITVPKGVLITRVENSRGTIKLDNVSGNVDAKASTGEIQIQGVDGLVKAETNMGKISVENVSGDVDAKTSSGEIQIHKVNGFVKAVTNNGKINITGVSGLYEARTERGDISVEVPAIRDNLEIRSNLGSIKAFLSPNLVAQLAASTSTGNVTYQDLPLTVNQSSQTMITGRLGEGGGKINITTSMGSISLNKL
ncbi:MAG TPA: DUF4097 family beta strand repeat-containing protein [Methylomusa anaerophila]|uniref:DUF4097 domain-containing protein n=1 Tax=Methylomusa anaerophila TaxID=1930071 RepID=A0A348AQU6_9FIRM|nr:DUF4097 family beta strand repeat-containing protein [Methylomusa anaerophila]BBB93444.1 hypothetical protein MAMMFC1_04161 [Methylomusa anaerophila]HML90306.1 DUF4097 family beta strand repeat-containing protein [Methylomusa anaerophila]